MIKGMKGLVPILDAGHGGMIGGQYQTNGKRSPNWSCGVLYEGAFNRWVINRLMELLDRNSMPYFLVSDATKDNALSERVNAANRIYGSIRSVYYLSIHANAGGGEGMEVYTSPGKHKSDLIADVFIDNLIKELPDHPLRTDKTDGDRDKEANFYVLTKTNCPALLVELAFMDSETDYKKLWSYDFIDGAVAALYNAIHELFYGVV